ncbi:C40 family peptidase [Oceanobacillus halotolerans]|uniref:C40 family peptidase n=1 Tax=Oceanobacillus halotolerans TaxID=2663380 RepID=UPI0013DD4A68|nr:NlpC/P60 family protein [Oceanobacillus halotolerans]
MLNGTVEHVVKQSFLYSYVLSQPFAVYVDAYPVLQNKLLLEAEQVQYSEHGETVRVLQEKLNKLSYYDDKIDGDYGILTEHALKKFQSDHNLTATGQTDKETIYAIIDSEKEKYIEKLENMSDSVQPGMQNDDVKIVQEALHYFGYYKGEIDGIYGPMTQKALETAENEHDMELTDHVDESALKALYDTNENESKSENENTDNTQKQGKQKETQPEVKQAETKDFNRSTLADVARSFIGTPYVWGGTSPSGFDCSGFIQYVFQSQGIKTPRTVSETWNFAEQISQPSIGDLVFFETYKPGPSHMGVYIGDGKFVHAGESRGVEISELSESYWEQRYIGAGRVK